MAVEIHDHAPSVSDEVIEGFRALGVGDIGHIQLSGFLHTAIRPVYRDIKLVGRAVTVRMPPTDSTLNRKALEVARPGDVIVVDRGGDSEIACWGGGLALLCKVKGIAGLIVDGAVTDSMEITDMRWPVYSRSLSGLLARKLGLDDGAINTPVTCGGVVVHPGDLIVGDDDGVVVIRPDEAERLLAVCQERFGGVEPIRDWIRAGKSLAEYPAAQKYFDTVETKQSTAAS